MNKIAVTIVSIASVAYFGLLGAAYADDESAMNQATWYQTVRQEHPAPFFAGKPASRVVEGRNVASRPVLEPYIQNSIEQNARSH